MKRVITNSFSGGALLLTTVAGAFFVTPILVRALGNHAYGAWEIILSISAYLALLDLGINPAVVRFVARSIAARQTDELRAIFDSSMIFGIVIGLAGCAITWILWGFSAQILNLPPHSVPGLDLAFFLTGISCAVTFPGTVLIDFLMGFQRHYLLNAIRIARAAFQALAIYFLATLTTAMTIGLLAGVLLAFAIVEYLIAATVLARVWPERRFARLRFSRSVFKGLSVFGVKSMGLMAAQRIQKQSIPIVISWVLGASQIVFYSIPNRLVDYAYDLTQSLGIPLTAHFSALDGLGDDSAVRVSWFRLSRYLQFVVFGISGALLAFGERFLAAWLGPEYAEGGTWVIRLLAIAFLLEGLAPNAGRVLVAFGKHGRAAGLAILVSVISVPLTVLACRWYGLAGAAASVLAARIAGICIQTALVLPLLRIGLFAHLRGTILRFLVPIFVYSTMLLWSVRTLHGGGFGEILVRGLIAALAYAVAAWLCALHPEERGLLVRALRIKLRTTGRSGR